MCALLDTTIGTEKLARYSENPGKKKNNFSF